jgi:hypothetical protein
MLGRYSCLLANPAMYWLRPPYVYAPLLAPFLETSIYDIAPLRRTLTELIDLSRLNPSDFSRAAIERRIAAGYHDALTQLEAFDRRSS